MNECSVCSANVHGFFIATQTVSKAEHCEMAVHHTKQEIVAMEQRIADLDQHLQELETASEQNLLEPVAVHLQKMQLQARREDVTMKLDTLMRQQSQQMLDLQTMQMKAKKNEYAKRQSEE